MTDGRDKETRRLAAKLRKKFQSTGLMNKLMDDLFGPGGWTYDPIEDVWIAHDRGPGAVVVFHRGGDWHVREGTVS
jgi:hypothetical protein